MVFFVLDYRRLMTTQAEFDRLQESVGIKLEDRRRMKLYRNGPGKSFLLKIVAWLIYKQTGRHFRKIIEQFETLR
jgi:ABC-type sulfate/molybdate transport systems ATPase subunit